MSQLAEDSTEEEIVPGASGCLIALVVIAMFACYGLGILTGGYGQRYLDQRKARNGDHQAFPDPDQPNGQPAAAAPLEPTLPNPPTREQAGAQITVDLATARMSRTGGDGEVKLPGLLLFRLRIKNLTNRPLDLTAWMHADVHKWPAQLSGSQNQYFDAVLDADERVGAYLMTLPGYKTSENIAPGAEAITWIAFSITKRPLDSLNLTLSANNFGGEGVIHFDIPAGAVAEGNAFD
jgi:hypothetical protein